MATNIKFGAYTPIEIDEIPPDVFLACKKVKELPINKKILVRLKVDGTSKKDMGGGFEMELIPSDKSIQLSTNKFNIERGWILETYVESKKEIENAYLQIKVDGVNRNKIYLNFNDDKDVFSEEDISRLIQENKNSISKHTACIIAADKQLGKLLTNRTDFITDESNNKANVYTAYTRIAQIKAKGFVKNDKIFEQSVFNGGGIYKPVEFTKGNEHVIFSYLQKAVNNKCGYHIFYFTILNGYHVLTLIVNATDPCNILFKIYDQLRDRGSYLSFSEIDTKLLEMNTNNWQGAADLTKDKTASTKFGIWKIQRK